MSQPTSDCIFADGTSPHLIIRLKHAYLLQLFGISISYVCLEWYAIWCFIRISIVHLELLQKIHLNSTVRNQIEIKELMHISQSSFNEYRYTTWLISVYYATWSYVVWDLFKTTNRSTVLDLNKFNGHVTDFCCIWVNITILWMLRCAEYCTYILTALMIESI